MKPTLLSEAAVQTWQETEHPSIDAKTIEEWQAIIDLTAIILDVPASLIMQLTDDKLSVFIRSETEGNPYLAGDSEVWFGSGLYCEKVLRSGQRLFVPNALEDEEWKDNPDVKLNMINYLGFSLHWPSGEPFGTICVLDNRTRHYTEEQEELMILFKNVIEANLALIENNRQLKTLMKKLDKLARIDGLTNALNRRTFYEQGEQELHRAKRYTHTFSILMIDIDLFKKVNDRHGHSVGDDALQAFAAAVEELKRTEDIFGRVGGEEFAILLPETDQASARQFAERLREHVAALIIPAGAQTVSFTVSIGITTSLNSDRELQQILNEADRALYDAKKSGRNRVCLYRD